jgi:hypothetical protein
VQRANFGHQVQVRKGKKKKKKKKKNLNKAKSRFKGPATPADPSKEDIVDEAIKFFKVNAKCDFIGTWLTRLHRPTACFATMKSRATLTA